MLNSKKGGASTSRSDVRDGGGTSTSSSDVGDGVSKGTGGQLVKKTMKCAALLSQTAGFKVSFLRRNIFTVVGLHCRRASVEVRRIAVRYCFLKNNRFLARRVRKGSRACGAHCDCL